MLSNDNEIEVLRLTLQIIVSPVLDCPEKMVINDMTAYGVKEHIICMGMNFWSFDKDMKIVNILRS